MSAWRKPPRLRLGMRLGVVAPSSSVLERSAINRGVAKLEQLGLTVVFGASARDSYGYLAGRDADRAADLLAMLERDDVDAVMCLRGGYGAIRTAKALDRDRLAGRGAKPFIGYSDITVAHAILGRELGWTTFYRPSTRSASLGIGTDHPPLQRPDAVALPEANGRSDSQSG